MATHRVRLLRDGHPGMSLLRPVRPVLLTCNRNMNPLRRIQLEYSKAATRSLFVHFLALMTVGFINELRALPPAWRCDSGYLPMSGRTHLTLSMSVRKMAMFSYRLASTQPAAQMLKARL